MAGKNKTGTKLTRNHDAEPERQLADTIMNKK
jgi:hypothetical protein